MHDSIEKWLEQLGLGQYAATFAENDIDVDLLPELTDGDLEKLGVSMGHRKRLLKAIKGLTIEGNATVDDTVLPTLATEAERPLRHLEAERRHLTLMFCDLVGSTELSGKLDPEDFHGVIRAYQETCTHVVTQFEGVVARYMGDGILVYFGYPQAHEHDAERAVRTGLGIVEAVARMQPRSGLSLQVRVGIATGLVVVGDIIGEGVSEESAASGETPNLAARLQADAEPNMVIISAATRNLVEGLFETVDLGKRQFKGIREPVAVWCVTGEREIESRFEAAHLEGLTPLVAREQEVELLMGRWELAKQRDGQIILLSGEPGIGKSRIAQTLRERIADEPHARLRFQCSPYHTNSALFPVITHLEMAAQFTSDDTAEEKLDKLKVLLAHSTKDLDSVVPFFAELLSIPTENRYPPLSLSPQRLKERTLALLVEQLLGLAADQPVLFIFEDAHWVDPTTLEFLDLVVDRTEAAPVLAMITFRSEFSPPWVGRTQVTSLTLNRLGRRHCETMVRKVTGDQSLPAEVLDQIVAKTDGMPLFVEELTKTVLESGILELTSDGYTLDGPLPPLAIPTSLRDSLMARLDRLAPVKEVAQIGATIGREFSYQLIASVSPLQDHQLRDALAQLVNAQLVFGRGAPPDAVYTFKHALVQDAAYESLLKTTRQRIHQNIATKLEDQFHEIAETRPELLAHHYTEAHLIDKAIHYWQLAGRRSSQRSATVEAITQLQKALELLDTLPPSAERDRTELDLRIDLTTPLIASKGMAAPEMGRTITRARKLCERLGETTRLFPVLYGQWVFHHVSGKVTKGLEFAREASKLAEGESSEVPTMVAHRTLGIGLIGLGEPHEARDHLTKGNGLYDAERHRPLALVYGMDFKQVNLAYLALADWFDGYPERARAVAREGVDFARSISHANSLCHALTFGAGTLHTFNRQFNAAKEVGEELLRLSAEHEMPQWSLFGRMYVAFGILEAGQNTEGISMLQACLEKCMAVPMLANSTLAYSILARSQAKNEAYRDALISIGEAEKVIELGGERWARSEVLRLKGEILDAQSGDAKAEQYLQSAINVAHKQPAKMLELRAATTLARVWHKKGKVRDARDLLTPLYGWFTEGFDSPDLKEARALLAKLN